MRFVLLGLFALIAAAMVFVRLAQVSAEPYHRAAAAQPVGDYPQVGRFLAVREVSAPPAQALAAIERVALATPRTALVAGSVDAGMMTFRTTSRLWAFPDFTTVSIIDGNEAGPPRVMIEGRLHYGQADLGVNKARVTGWLAQLHDVIAAP